MLQKILNILFPTKCIFCKITTESICKNCFLAIPQIPIYRNNIYSFYKFKNEEVAKLLKDLKYYHNGEVAKKFGQVLAKEIVKLEFQNVFLIPIPLNKSDLRLHNHAELIATAIAENINSGSASYTHATVLNILQKNSKKQQNKTDSRVERFENIRNTFSISKTERHSTLGGNANIYILIDDVTTSGATINEARTTIEKKLGIKALAFTVAY